MSLAAEKLRVGVLFGGRSGEHEVSLMSARSVLAYLDRSKYEVIEIGITHDGDWLVGEQVLEAFEHAETQDLQPVVFLPQPNQAAIYTLQPQLDGSELRLLAQVDVFFPVLHGTFGEDGTLQGLFEIARVPYVGAGVLGSSVGMDKGVFKDVMKSNGIPVLETMVVLRSELETDLAGVLERAETIASFPLFVKPANLGSSVGITKCRHRSDLMEGLMEAARYDRRILIERGIEPREIEVSVLGNDHPQASLPGEIIPKRDFYSYEAKYIDASSELLIPAPLEAGTAARVQELAIRAYRAIDCAGMARVDFLLDKVTGELYLGELNTIPGFTQISMYPKLWEASGLSYPDLLDRLIELALDRKAQRDRTEWRYQRGL
jgi:D-alanine-D-alanine ligase